MWLRKKISNEPSVSVNCGGFPRLDDGLSAASVLPPRCVRAAASHLSLPYAGLVPSTSRPHPPNLKQRLVEASTDGWGARERERERERSGEAEVGSVSPQRSDGVRQCWCECVLCVEVVGL